MQESFEITLSWLKHWMQDYQSEVDAEHYDPYLEAARKGDKTALLALTRWKNTGSNGRPMNLSRNKQKTFDLFASRLDLYLMEDGQNTFRADFANRAPVWSTFWAHVLYGTPIFDWRTHVCYLYFTQKRRPTRAESIIIAPKHWEAYDNYSAWFERTYQNLRIEDNAITRRDLDRALFMFGPHALSANS
jgi:hypothetical protein